MNASELLSRLQDPASGGPLDQLAALLVEDALERPVAELLPPPFVARALKEGLGGWLASERALPELAAAVEELRRALQADGRTVGEALPKELAEALEALASRPFSPDRSLVLALLEREPVRKLIRGFVLDVVLDFGRKLRAPVTESKVARGLGGLARLAAEQAKARTGALGALAGSVVGSVSDELERQLDKRANEFADAALNGILEGLADQVADPGQARSHAELRVAILDSALELKLSHLGQELKRADAVGAASAVRESLARWLARPQAEAELEKAVAALQRRNGARPLREVLGELGLLEPARALGRDFLRARLGPAFHSPAFARWLEALVGSGA